MDTQWDYLSPDRYWSDDAGLLAQFDAVDAQLDREDSLSERQAFQLGRDLGRYRLHPPAGKEGAVKWPHEAMQSGYAFGIQQDAQRSDRYIRKLLQLQISAWVRRIPVSSAISAEYLRTLVVPVCPVSGATLTHGTRSDTDWSVDRLENSLGYVPGNLCVVSTRVNRLKSDYSFEALTDQAQTAMLDGVSDLATELPTGLLVLETFRLAALMAAPSGYARGQLALYPPLATAPCVWTTPNTTIAAIHVACARSRVEGAAYHRRHRLFHGMGRSTWRESNSLVKAIRHKLAMEVHPADIWLDGDALWVLLRLTERYLGGYNMTANMDGRQLATMRAGLAPLASYAR